MSSLLSYNRRAFAGQKVALSGQKLSLEVLAHPTNSGNQPGCSIIVGVNAPDALLHTVLKSPSGKKL